MKKNNQDSITLYLIPENASGFSQDDYENVDELFCAIHSAPQQELAKLLKLEPEKLEKKLDDFNHILNCIQFKWDKKISEE